MLINGTINTNTEQIKSLKKERRNPPEIISKSIESISKSIDLINDYLASDEEANNEYNSEYIEKIIIESLHQLNMNLSKN